MCTPFNVRTTCACPCIGGLATEAEIEQYMSSLRDTIETKYGLLRKAFLSMDKDRSMALTKEEVIEGLQNFCIPVRAVPCASRELTH